MEKNFATPEVKILYNSENYHFVNHLCAYLRYNNIPELFTFMSKNVNNVGMLYLWNAREKIILAFCEISETLSPSTGGFSRDKFL